MVLPLIGKHLVYEFENMGGARYEAYYQSEDRIVYKIHGGPMKGRSAYQKAFYQQIAENIYMISWVEETGSTVTVVVNLNAMTVNAFIAFSQGHWTLSGKALGDKRNPDDLARWRRLSLIGNTTSDRIPKPIHARIIKVFDGPGDLEPVTDDMPVF